MRKTFLMLCLFLFSGILKAQLDTFDLSSYKLPDIKRHQLDFNFNLNGNNRTTDRYQRLNSDYYNKSNDIKGGLGLNYIFFRNSDLYQGEQNCSFGFKSSFSNTLNKDSLTRENYNLVGYIIINSLNRFYVKDKFFLEADLYFNGQYSNSNYDYITSNSKYKDSDLDVNISLGSGVGRIEQVQDSWLAIYILDELNKQGKLSRIPTQDEIIEFSKLISQLKNERFFDARLQKIKEIEEVDAFLQSKGLINEPDSKYFTVVNDNWDNSANQVRNSGKRVSFTIIPGYTSNYYLTEQTTFDSENRRTEYNVMASLSYINEKPINLYWQNSFNVTLSGNYLKGIEEDIYNDTKKEVESPQIKSSIYNRISYYPSSRTDISMTAGLVFNNYFGTESIENVQNNINHFELFPYLRLSLNYYISPQLLLNAYYNIQYNYIESNSDYYRSILLDDFIQEKQIYQYLNIRFVYQIF